MITEVTPEKVREAYIKTGYKPQQRIFLSVSNKVCCGVGALWLAYTPDAETRAESLEAEYEPASYNLGAILREVLPKDFDVTAFELGFDVKDQETYEKTQNFGGEIHRAKEYKLGFECWQAVKDLVQE